MNPVSLVRLEAELEYGAAIRGDIVPVTPQNASDVPLVTIARYTSGYVRLLRGDLTVAERERLTLLQPDDLFVMLDAQWHELGFTRVIHCSWYVINRIPDPAEFPDVLLRDGRFVIEEGGQIAAEAWSSQDGLRAAEVEVETAEPFRRRGFGRQVVAAWTRHVRRDGKIALYSHLQSNQASRALAASLGAWKYAETREFFGNPPA